MRPRIGVTSEDENRKEEDKSESEYAPGTAAIINSTSVTAGAGHAD
jgi:hypothetical protein